MRKVLPACEASDVSVALLKKRGSSALPLSVIRGRRSSEVRSWHLLWVVDLCAFAATPTHNNYPVAVVVVAVVVVLLVRRGSREKEVLIDTLFVPTGRPLLLSTVRTRR